MPLELKALPLEIRLSEGLPGPSVTEALPALSKTIPAPIEVLPGPSETLPALLEALLSPLGDP